MMLVQLLKEEQSHGDISVKLSLLTILILGMNRAWGKTLFDSHTCEGLDYAAASWERKK